MSSRYVEWLRREGLPLFKARHIYWQLYNRALVPASPGPCFTQLTSAEAMKLLQESGAWFLHYASDPSETETEWWYIVCDSYDQTRLSANTRSKINRSRHNCSVSRLEPEWLAVHGYECHAAAYDRYKHTTPVDKETFRKHILQTIEGPFEHWGVFVGDVLAGYCQCIVDDKDVATSVVKLDPRFLKYYSSYALMRSLIEHYVLEHRMVMNNGTRSLVHDTNFQTFLLKLGFRKQFCRLNIVYTPWIEKAVAAIFPFRKVFARLPDKGPVNKIRALLFQEEVKRSRQC